MFFFLAFLSIPLSHATNKLDVFQYCLLHWVSATKNCFVCRTEPLQQTDFLFVALSHCEKQSLYMIRKKTQKWPKNATLKKNFFATFGTFCYLMAFVYPFLYFCLKILNTLAFCVQYIFVCRSDKQKIYLSQWLSATNKTNLCQSDSVWQIILRKISN